MATMHIRCHDCRDLGEWDAELPVNAATLDGWRCGEDGRWRCRACAEKRADADDSITIYRRVLRRLRG